jgi:hypothetical protein
MGEKGPCQWGHTFRTSSLSNLLKDYFARSGGIKFGLGAPTKSAFATRKLRFLQGAPSHNCLARALPPRYFNKLLVKSFNSINPFIYLGQHCAKRARMYGPLMRGYLFGLGIVRTWA